MITKSTQMNSKQAKQIAITDLLLRLHHKPHKQPKPTEIFYYSPFRNERTPSFTVDPIQNVWFDCATRQGGNIMDLVMGLYNLTFTEALKKLSEIMGTSGGNSYKSQTSHQHGKTTQETNNPTNQTTSNIITTNNKNNYTISSTKPIQNQALIDYLHSRKIDLETAKLYLQEIYYTASNDKNYFGLYHQNQKGSYEIRNKYSKMVLGEKYYTYIPYKSTPKLDFQDDETTQHKPTENNNQDQTTNNNKLIINTAENQAEQPQTTSKVSIFEGMFDFLSLLVSKKLFRLDHDVIVLNSTSMINSFLQDYFGIVIDRYGNVTNIEIKNPNQYTTLDLYLDKDSTGNKSTNHLLIYVDDIEINDLSNLYAGYGDLGEWWEKSVLD